MSEVGLVPFARVALEVAREVLPSYSHRFSPQRFTQPQLLAILCLMRYEDWTFRGAEIRLGEHGELRRTLEVQAVPDHSTLFRFMLRLEERVIGQALAEVVRRLQKKSRARAEQRLLWRWTRPVWPLGPSARFSFAGASSMVVLPCRGVIGSNGFLPSIRAGA